MDVNPAVASVLKAFHDAKKPIGACCIAPVIIARLFPGVKVTLGQEKVSEEYPFADACKAANQMGATNVPCGVMDRICLYCRPRMCALMPKTASFPLQRTCATVRSTSCVMASTT